ncbi:MAG TPA: TonB-dependent receptor [Pyrinomonadaceae bacterium]
MRPKVLILLVALFSFSLTAAAQTSRGTVSGVVTDPAGAVVSGATVTLTSTTTGLSRDTTTNEEGFYRFDAVDLGTYSVNIAASGFGALTKTNIIVNANQTSAIDAQLSPGGQEVTIDVIADAGAALQTEAPVRGGNISTVQITQLPISSRNPVGLALTLPGVSSNTSGVGIGSFSVNGARSRSNNFLIDGTENNDISVAGQGFQITNPDAVQEVSVQTSNYDAEFGRAGGGVVNVITKAGTNEFHGTLAFQYDSSADDAITSLQSRNPTVIARGRPLSATQYIPSATLGGPLYLPRFGEGGRSVIDGRNRTFFFVAYQETRFRSPGGTVSLVTPTQAGRDRLRALFPVGTSPNVDQLLSLTQNAVGTATPFNVALGTVSGVNRGDIQFGTFFRPVPTVSTGKQFQLRIDHKLGENDQLSGRFLRDTNVQPRGGSTGFEGFDADFASKYNNFLLTETHVFSPTLTNELRLAYNRIDFGFPLSDPGGLAGTLPSTTIGSGVSGFGANSAFPQGRIANNYVVQDTMTKVSGNHTFRGGIDYLRQISRQSAPFNSRGTLNFGSSTGFTSFANFVDNFGGTGSVSRDFGSPVYFPSLHRTAAFFQDRWKATESLTLTLGIRYENFGTPFNTLRTPAFTGLFNVDPVTLTGPFSQPNKVQSDNNNFAPTVGIAYSPSFTSGVLGTIFGEKRSVLRAGYQIGYDSFFNNIASNASSSSPNSIVTTISSTPNAANPRGTANLSSQFPTTAAALTPRDSQTLIDRNLVNPYYQRYSLGFQRELPFKLIMDTSYVGSRGVKLFISEDVNPLVRPELRITPAAFTGSRTCTPGTAGCLITNRLDNLQGSRLIRTNGGSSTYHAGQLEVRRRFADNFQITGAYTYSKLISNADEVFAIGVGTAATVSALPIILGGDRLERAVSQFDRTHRGVFTYVVESPFFREQRGFIGKLLGGYQVSGVTTLESGSPYTVFNGLDSDGIGGGNERPTFNPNGQRGVRAIPIVAPATLPGSTPGTTIPNPNFGAITGYYNPDQVIGFNANGTPIFVSGLPGQPTIDPNTAQFIVNPTFLAGAPMSVPRFGNLGRNTERAPGINNTNLNFLKRTRISESVSIETRAEFFNAFNHPQFTSSVSSNANSTIGLRFLNPDTPVTSGGAREIRYQVKLIF